MGRVEVKGKVVARKAEIGMMTIGKTRTTKRKTTIIGKKEVRKVVEKRGKARAVEIGITTTVGNAAARARERAQEGKPPGTKTKEMLAATGMDAEVGVVAQSGRRHRHRSQTAGQDRLAEV